MSARSASEPAAPAELASSRRVRVLGTARTFEVRDQLRGLGLRWDPATHAWHGTIRAGEEVVLERELRVRAQVVHPIEAFAAEASPEPPSGPKPPVPSPRAAGEPRGPPRDGSRTRAEARTAYREDSDEDPERQFHPRFNLWDTTSGLPDDSREADERATERRLRDLRGRVKAARAALSARPEAKEAFRADWGREAAFYARFGITQAQFQHGVPFTTPSEEESAQPLPPPSESSDDGSDRRRAFLDLGVSG
ncbi:MAG: hypothetical protein L3K18_02805 [Thermoplasmata archaeon]|nr:hypothetical protein [Thermoplasmata archaeon]